MGNRIPTLSSMTLNPSQIRHESLFEYTVANIDGVETPLSQYKGCGALLVTNVASKCGLTKYQYPGLVELRKRFVSRGEKFEVLAFPCSQFANQEPGTAEDIKQFVKQYNVEFPLFEKLHVNGPNTHPIYCFLKYNTPELCDYNPNKNTVTLKPIGWNFGKFLIDSNGHVVRYYGPKVNPLECEEDIRKTINGELQGATSEPPPSTATITHCQKLPEDQSCTRSSNEKEN